jgi:hypothetical protein
VPPSEGDVSSYALPNDTTRTGACTYVEETTPGDVWTPVGSIVFGLREALPMRGMGYYKRRVVLKVVGATQYTTLMAGLKDGEDEISFDGHTYSLLNVEAQVICSNDSRDMAKQNLVTVELWRP